MLVLLNAVKNDRQLMALLGRFSQSTRTSTEFA
jgi:hypothetical protein